MHLTYESLQIKYSKQPPIILYESVEASATARTAGQFLRLQFLKNADQDVVAEI